ADDLTQETYLAALTTIRRGRKIQYPKTWLANTLMHLWNNRLREKYRMVTVTYTEGIPEPTEEIVTSPQEETELRMHIASLTKLYRDVIVLHYIGGLTVEQVAERLAIPAGTVKRRLHDGREKIRKGKEKMETKELERITPMQVSLSWTGTYPGDELMNLARGNLMQQILACTYAKPMTQEEISETIQIPVYYFEDLLEKAVEQELVIKNGDKFCTNAYLRTLDREQEEWNDTVQYVQENLSPFQKCHERIETAVDAMSFSHSISSVQMQKLKRFAFLETLQTVKGDFTEKNIDLPVHKSGCAWLLIGKMVPLGWVGSKDVDILAGHRTSGYQYASDKPECQLHEFDTTLWDCPNRYMYKNWLWSMCNLLYAVFREADPLSCGVPADMLEAIPQFKEYGLFREKEGKLQVDIPILTREEYALVNALCQKESDLLRESIAESLTVFQKTQYKTAPSHLGINAEFWTDKHALWHLEPAVYRTLYDHGIHLKDVDYCCPPAVFVID
ncbi:MAG: RNA polymerase sigma factor, partial [Clostridia bacterium]|nr:RNA polymerase sigma factor [Clostridia bacterium]